MLLTDFHYKLIADLEHKYGNLYNVPEDDVKLKIIRDRINQKPKIKITRRKKGFSKYDYVFCYDIYLSRIKDRSLTDLSDEFDLPSTSVGNVMYFYGVRPYKQYTAKILNKNEQVIAHDLDSLIKKLRKYKEFKKFDKTYASHLITEGGMYKGILLLSRINRYPKFTLNDFKKKAFLNKVKNSKTKSIDKIVKSLNKINGEGVYTFEEVNRWNRG